MTGIEKEERMKKEALIQDIFNQMCTDGEINKGLILDYLLENYKSDSYIPAEFNKIYEMGQMLSLVERIKKEEIDAGTEFPKRYETSKEAIKAIVYCVALMESKKHKIDIFKVYDDFDIDQLLKKYNLNEI